MTNPRGAWLDDLTLPDLQARFDDDAVVVVPAFAATALPDWLPIKTGAAIARAVGQRLVDRLPVIATRETLEQELAGRAAGLKSLGITRLVVVDASFSGGPCAPPEAATLVVHVGADASKAADADEIDTSLMYALDPRSIRVDLLPPSSGASAFKGERAMAAAIERIVAALVVRWPDLSM
ncbi:MAG: hypothetical protein EPO67_02775 [Reyranella sp.]|nr:MAG: hypothetical protein EPO67_02775 [Reyranella sp.]